MRRINPESIQFEMNILSENKRRAKIKSVSQRPKRIATKKTKQTLAVPSFLGGGF